jgi:hypothetical protein
MPWFRNGIIVKHLLIAGFGRINLNTPVSKLLKLEESSSYKNVYSGFFGAGRGGRKCLILLVGASRFELETACAQGSNGGLCEIACFQLLTVQWLGGTLLKPVETC